MNYSKIIFPIFIMVALVQLYVPAKMILDREDVLATGKEYKFKTLPIDPTDPFRGKYIVLRFDENEIIVDEIEEWNRNEIVYVLLSEDNFGFAKAEGVSREKPTGNDFVKAKIKYVKDYAVKTLIIEYPFERFYMEESKAYDAEQITRQQQQEIVPIQVDSVPRVRESMTTTQQVYAVVQILEGESVLKDVMIGGESMKDVVKRHQTME